MPDLDLSPLAAEAVLGFGIWALMLLMTSSLAVWFACSIVESVIRMGRQVRRSDYHVLLRENERLRGSLSDAREENHYLRKLYRDFPPREEDGGRHAA